MNNYYVYIYLDTRKPGIYKYNTVSFDYEPFYIGKGKNKRMYVHKWKSKELRKQHIYNKIQNIIKATGNDPIIIKYKDGLTNEEAYSIEEKLVREVGRIIENKGPLINKAIGGHGSNGHIPSKESLERKSIKIKEWFKNNPHPLLGKKRSKEICEKVSKSRMGLKYSRESYLKGKITRGCLPIIQYDLKGNQLKEWDFIIDAAKSLNINHANITTVAKGKRKTAGGFIWKYKTLENA